MPTYSYPTQRRRGILLFGVAMLAALAMMGAALAIRAHRHPTVAPPSPTASETPTPTPISTASGATPTPVDPLAGITPMPPMGVAGFPIVHMLASRTGSNVAVTLDDGAATPLLSIHANVPAEGTSTPPAGTGCGKVAGQIPVCLMRLQAHQGSISAWIEAQAGQCELIGSTTPGVRTVMKCTTTHQ